MPDKRPVKQERALRTRASLIRAAAEVFAESGFAGASVSRIADRAGVTLGAMYFHFKNKEALAREIVRSQPDIVSPPIPSDGLQKLVDITLTWSYQMLDEPLLLAGARLVTDQELFISSEENSHQQWTVVAMSAFAEANELGQLQDGVNIPALARMLVSACTGAQMHAQMESGRRDLPDRVEEIWHCILPAIAGPGVAGQLEFGEARGRPASRRKKSESVAG
ncbi:ScbR family autoregulator-binding transcription factor [Streptomyces sp. NBC_01433]|uniref:ScbR family autoregulator-binding transcription factor n=1 Tax=Streptomyces sp. NBC_01433 TaxID=2903864 RepID=UPI002255E666|nr:ScbR family autoregulator-binding transcription factor [Streptomyces sp. NBC_01433]MCX4681780.1 ScbR family autoregulator-binding transcription factor [Streptomyces sp. NBC_01433]